MNFLLDRSTREAWVRRVGQRALQNLPALHVSAITVMTLELWLRHANTPGRYLQGYTAARQQLKVVSVDEAVAYRAAPGTCCWARCARSPAAPPHCWGPAGPIRKS